MGGSGRPQLQAPAHRPAPPHAVPTGGVGRGRGPAAAALPRPRAGPSAAIFNVFGHRSLRSLGTRACGRPGSCWDSAVAARWTPAPAREEASAAPVGLPSRSVPVGPPVPPRARGGRRGSGAPGPQCSPPMPDAVLTDGSAAWAFVMVIPHPRRGPLARDGPFSELRRGGSRGPPSALPPASWPPVDRGREAPPYCAGSRARAPAASGRPRAQAGSVRVIPVTRGLPSLG